jgi:uncharacterized protein involved in outer membrane biogenesis
MKKLLKIFGYSIITILTLVIILLIVVSVSQNKIIDFTREKISQSINAPIKIDDFSFTLFKRFPYATVEVSGLKIGQEKSNLQNTTPTSKKDIINIKTVFVSVKSVPLFKGIYEIENIDIENAVVNYEIDSMGKSNIDFLLNYQEKTEIQDVAQKDTRTSINLFFDKVELRNTTINYLNDTLQMAANINIAYLEIQGKMVDETISGIAKGEVELLNLNSVSIPDKIENVSVSFDLGYKNDTLTIKTFDASTDGANILTKGKINFSDSLYANLELDVKKLELGKFYKYVPEKTLKEYNVEQVGGTLHMSGNVTGIYSETEMPLLNFEFGLEQGSLKTKDYPQVNNVSAEGEYSNGKNHNLQTSSALLKSFHAETKMSSVDLSLKLSNLEKPNYDLKSKFKINLDEFKSYIPDSLIQNISGIITGNLSTKGQMPDSIDSRFINHLAYNSSGKLNLLNLFIETDSLQINDLSALVVYSPNEVKINNLQVNSPQWDAQINNTSIDAGFAGNVTQPKDLIIDLKSFYTESPQGKFWGSALVENLEHPDFELSSTAEINLTELKPFIPDSLVRDISGNLTAKINSKGKLDLDSIEYQINDIVFKQSKIHLEANDISATMPDTIINVANLNGVLQMENGTISISKMSGTASNISFELDSTEIANVYNTAIKNQRDTVKAFVNLKLGNIEYSMITPFLNNDSSIFAENIDNTQDTIQLEFKTGENANISWERNFLFDVKGKIAVKRLQYDKIFLDDILTKFHATDSVYIVDQFRTKAFDGFTVNSLRYALTKNNKQIIHIKNQIENMDVYKLLFAFDDFGYDSIMSYKNISGIFSTDISSRFVFSNDSLITNDMRVLGEFKLKNGKLVNYYPAMEISNFTGIKELDNIEMKTLNCDIFMFKNQLFVPITKIVSSSMDVTTFGMQSLDENYEYHLHLRLGEILKGKSKKLFERQSTTGDDVTEDDLDKNTIKLIYAYNDGKKRIGFATRREQKKMELTIKTQQKMLELIFHPILVSYETGVK